MVDNVPGHAMLILSGNHIGFLPPHDGFGPAKIAFIPSSNFNQKDLLPPVAVHIFYHRRQSDAVDDLPKYSGYLRSNLATVKLIMGVLQS